MAHAGFLAFSPDSAFLASCNEDGKLKIYETQNNRLRHEYVPNLHLSSPCSAVTWIKATSQSNNTQNSPWRKRKKKSMSEDVEDRSIVAMGSANGTITLYDVAAGTVCGQLEGGHTSTVTALTWSAQLGLFSAAEDKHVVQWNLQDSSVVQRWKAGKGKITAIALLPESKTILTADRMIKWWDLTSCKLIKTFTGHANQITWLGAVTVDEISYLVSSSANDTYLSIWSLNQTTQEQSLAATLLTQDEPLTASVCSYKTDHLTILTTTRIGQTHLFKYKFNSSSTKPLKPTLTVSVFPDSKTESEKMPILMSDLTSDAKIILAYGSQIIMQFEKVVPDFSEKFQSLTRSELKKTKERKDEALLKVKVADTESKVEYLVPGTTAAATKRNFRSSTGAQLPLKDRLENLSLDEKNQSEKGAQSKGESMVNLLIQGLQSKERNIIENVLYNKQLKVIHSTISRLPVQAIVPLLKELTIMLQGKTYPSKIATLWLTTLTKVHAGQIMSHPDIVEALTPILSYINIKLKLVNEISKLRGRVNLITGQIVNAQEKDNREKEEALLVYQDPDSSEDDTDIGEMEMSSESDENWEELSNLDAHSEDEVMKSDDNESVCS